MSGVRINLNDYVRVRLTPVGRAMLEKEHADLLAMYPRLDLPYRPPAQNEDGQSFMQLHEVMHKFGSVMFNGSTNVPIEKCAIEWHPDDRAPTRSTT
jgi:hypothetical protein